jgi:hypothetical protein
MGKLVILFVVLFIPFISISQIRGSKYSFTMVSNQSEIFYDFSSACAYCDSLTEGGYSDWILPNAEEWIYICTGGALNSFSRNDTWLMMRDSLYDKGINWRRIWGNTRGEIIWVGSSSGCSTPIPNYNSCPQYVRCIR